MHLDVLKITLSPNQHYLARKVYFVFNKTKKNILTNKLLFSHIQYLVLANLTFDGFDALINVKQFSFKLCLISLK